MSTPQDSAVGLIAATSVAAHELEIFPLAERAPDALEAVLPGADLLCLSHLRWDFVFQRPHHLMARFAKWRRVFFIEEPVHDERGASLHRMSRNGVQVVVPHVPPGLGAAQQASLVEAMIAWLTRRERLRSTIVWCLTPMMLPLVRNLQRSLLVYDCMDELSSFAHAPPELREREQDLFRQADVVFTGGHSLYEAKRDRHQNIHPHPSSIDRAHFASARRAQPEPPDQAGLPRPRIGFFGVVDERMDLDLVAGVAQARPEWQIVMLGPVVKIDEASLPRMPNLHWLGRKTYAQLPSYISGWDAAILPFARNDATRFISPTKTPEYLAAGRPVVSTSIRDVVRPYAERGVVRIADDVPSFVAALDESLRENTSPGSSWNRRVDELLSATSWDRTWGQMVDQMASTVRAKTTLPLKRGVGG